MAIPFVGGIIGKIIQAIVDAFYGIFKKEQTEAKAKKADALEGANKSVGASLEVEKNIRDKQDAVSKPENKTTVETPDGGLSFSGFNKPPAEVPKAEVPKVEEPKKEEAPKVDPPKVEEPKPEVKVEEPKAEPPKV
jgi:hypothetical protein